MIARLFEAYANGDASLKEVTRLAGEIGLTHPRVARRLAKSEIHRILRNPIYAGEFLWKGKRYKGHHEPIISMALFEQVQEVFEEANRPKYTKRRHAFAGLVNCGRCGCAMTAEMKKGRPSTTTARAAVAPAETPTSVKKNSHGCSQMS